MTQMQVHPPVPPPERLVTVGEVCGRLGIGRTKFYELCQQGVFSVFNLNADAPRGPVRKGQRRAAIRVDEAEVDAYLSRIKTPARA